MKNYHLTTLLFTLFVCTANHAQITFDFTAGSFDGTTWTQTVEGVTCTATFDDDGTFLDVATLSGQNGKTFIDSSEGMYMGEYVGPPSAQHRTGFARPGARITFSQDVRLKSYTLGRSPENDYTVCVLVGGNVTGIANHGGEFDDHTGERVFALESLVPAEQTIATTVVGNGHKKSIWRLSSLTVELEPYVEPVIPIPEGNETGITRISTVGDDNSKHSFALKNGRLHVWTDSSVIYLSRDFIFDGGESGVLDFWTSTGVSDSPAILLETVEGYVIFNTTDKGYIVRQPLSQTLPPNPDQIGIIDNVDAEVDTVMALKDGVIFFDGADAEAFRTGMPAELSSGGVSKIAAGFYTALAVKDGKLYVWGIEAPLGTFSLLTSPIPSEITNGSVLHLATNGITAVAQLTTGEVIQFGHSNETLTAEQTSGELFADLRYENEHIFAIREDGSILMPDKQVGVGEYRYGNYDGGAFYVEDDTGSEHNKTDFLLRGLETPPTIVQQLGYEQISFGHENVAALLPGGRMIIWGGVDIYSTDNRKSNPLQAEAVPAQINEIVYPQTGIAPINEFSRPNVGELEMLQAGALGIQWGGNGTPQYEVQTTTDINDASSWQSLPIGTDPNLRFYRIKEITQDPQ